MSKFLTPLLAALLLTACVSNVRPVEPAQYDLGNLSGQWGGSAVPIAVIEVQPASWLAGPELDYRLLYAEPLRRQSYAEARWAAPPAELLERFLKRRIVFGQADFSGSGCRLNLALDELDQRFDDARSSKQRLDVRATLSPLRGGALLAKRAFLIEKAAPSADARGGVAATREAVQALADEMGNWLAALAAASPELAARCREK